MSAQRARSRPVPAPRADAASGQYDFGFLVNQAPPAASPAGATDDESLDALPDGEETLVALARVHLGTYNHAVLQGDLRRAKSCGERIQTIARKMHGRPNTFGIASKKGGLGRLSQRLRAPDGTVPLHGQPGRFVIETAHCRVLVVMDTLAGAAATSMHLHAVDLDRPFLSETGFHAFYSSTGFAPVLGRDVAQTARKLTEDWVNSLTTRGRLHPITHANVIGDRRKRERDPAWKPGGWLHSLASAPAPMPPAEKPQARRRAKP